MRKKILSILLTVTIIIQIAIPLGMLIYKAVEINLIKTQGEFHTFSGYSPRYYNGRLTVSLHVFGPNKQYVTIATDPDGIKYYEHSEEKPGTPFYIDRYAGYYATNDFGVNFPEVYLVTENYDNISSIYFNKILSFNSYTEEPPEDVAYYEEATIDAYIYKGKIYVTEIYIDGIESATFLEQYNNR